MPGGGVRRVNTAPPEELRAPSDVGVLAVDEKVGVEEAAFQLDVLDHAAAKQSGGGAGAEHVFHAAGKLGFRVVPAAVEMAHSGSEEDAGGIDVGVRQRFEAG